MICPTNGPDQCVSACAVQPYYQDWLIRLDDMAYKDEETDGHDYHADLRENKLV